jgi:peptidoglycan-associated lipoprotein
MFFYVECVVNLSYKSAAVYLNSSMMKKGVTIMRKNLGLVILLAFLLVVVFIAGCGPKKEILKEDSAKPSAMAEPAAEAKPVEQAASAEKAESKTKFTVLEPVVEAEKPAPAEAAVARKAETVAVSAKELYELADVNFDFDKFNLRDEARATLKKHAEWLNKNKDVMIVVEGHCDERGTAEYNLALGERRANAAAKFLVDMGIDAKRIKTLSYGEELPLDKGHSEAAWARNRRAHFDASGKK